MLGTRDFPRGGQRKSHKRTEQEHKRTRGTWEVVQGISAAPAFPGSLCFILETRTDESLEEID